MDSMKFIHLCVKAAAWWCVWMRSEKLERETGIEPVTNGLGSRYSTIELLPLC